MEGTGIEKGEHAQKGQLSGKAQPVPGVVSSSMLNVAGPRRCRYIPGKSSLLTTVRFWRPLETILRSKAIILQAVGSCYCFFKTGLT